MKVYNTKFLKGNQKMRRAIGAGIISALLCAIAYALIESILPWSFSLFYIAMAYGVSYSVKTYGKGVQTKFSTVGVVCTVLTIILGKLILYMYPFGFDFVLLPYFLKLVLQSFFVLTPHGIIELLCFAYAIYVAYYNSRII